MKDQQKQILLIVLTVAALAVAVFGAIRFFGGEQQQVVETLPHDPNFKSEKQMALEAQGNAAPPAAEADLSGAIGGQPGVSGKDRDAAGR